MHSKSSESFKRSGIPENHHDFLAVAQAHQHALTDLQRKGFPLNHPLVQHHLEQHTNAARSASIRQP